MRNNKIKKTITVAFFVSIAAQINLNILTEGFIVALSVMVMAIFIKKSSQAERRIPPPLQEAGGMRPCI